MSETLYYFVFQVEKKKHLIFVSQMVEETVSLLNKNMIAESQDNKPHKSEGHIGSVTTWASLAGVLFTVGLETVLMCCRGGVPFAGVLAELITLAPCGSQVKGIVVEKISFTAPLYTDDITG